MRKHTAPLDLLSSCLERKLLYQNQISQSINHDRRRCRKLLLHNLCKDLKIHQLNEFFWYSQLTLRTHDYCLNQRQQLVLYVQNQMDKEMRVKLHLLTHPMLSFLKRILQVLSYSCIRKTFCNNPSYQSLLFMMGNILWCSPCFPATMHNFPVL